MSAADTQRVPRAPFDGARAERATRQGAAAAGTAPARIIVAEGLAEAAR